ncbi:MAG: dihydroorotase [Bacteroidales bacterium]
MKKLLIKGGTIINEGVRYMADLLIVDGVFHSMLPFGTQSIRADQIIDASGLFVLPGIIDDQVHFREPGLETKGTIASESRAAVAGGITSFMEMPNTNPPTVTNELVKAKRAVAALTSWCNYSFYLGATNHNIQEIRNINPVEVCGVKVFMGSSTGNLLVDLPESLRSIFSSAGIPVAVHSEDEETIRANTRAYFAQYGPDGDASLHPMIRSHEACVLCTGRAIALSRETGGHLHLLHLSTAEEVEMIRKAKSQGVNVTGEVCVHHLFFTDSDYASRGNFIKWNPSIKSEADSRALIAGLKDGTIDIVATDHAPHEKEKKEGPYFQAPSGGPLVEHSLLAMLELAGRGLFSPEEVVTWMAHKPAELFGVDKRGFIREGFYADLVLVKPDDPWVVEGDKTNYLVKWSPLEGIELSHKVITTIVNGRIVYHQGEFFQENRHPMPLRFTCRSDR